MYTRLAPRFSKNIVWKPLYEQPPVLLIHLNYKFFFKKIKKIKTADK